MNRRSYTIFGPDEQSAAGRAQRHQAIRRRGAAYAGDCAQRDSAQSTPGTVLDPQSDPVCRTGFSTLPMRRTRLAISGLMGNRVTSGCLLALAVVASSSCKPRYANIEAADAAPKDDSGLAVRERVLEPLNCSAGTNPEACLRQVMAQAESALRGEFANRDHAEVQVPDYGTYSISVSLPVSPGELPYILLAANIRFFLQFDDRSRVAPVVNTTASMIDPAAPAIPFLLPRYSDSGLVTSFLYDITEAFDAAALEIDSTTSTSSQGSEP